MLKNIFVVFLIFMAASAQNVRASDREESRSFQKMISIGLANDIANNTNKSFSNGLKFSITSPFMKHSPVNYILIPNGKEDSVFYSLTLQHDMYTPQEKFSIEKQLTQTPFAAYFLAGSKKEAFNKKSRYRLASQLQLGVIGPSALGEEMQNAIHRIFPKAAQVNGWENQIGNDFCIMYSASFEKGLADAGWFNLDVVSAGAFGNPFTHLEGGFAFRAGLFDYYFENFGFSRSGDWQIFGYGHIRARAVGYNATLQGGLFRNNSVYTRDDISRILRRFVIGLAIIHGSFKIELEQHFTTPEFEAAEDHKWGNINIQFLF